MLNKIFLFLILSVSSSAYSLTWVGACLGLGGTTTLGVAAASMSLQEGEKIEPAGYAAAFVTGCLGGILFEYVSSYEITEKLQTQYSEELFLYTQLNVSRDTTLCIIRDTCPAGGIARVKQEMGEIQDMNGVVTQTVTATIEGNGE